MNNFKVQMYDFNGDLVELTLFQLLQWKHAIKLEIKTGLKMSGNRSVITHVKKFLSCPRSYKKEDLYDHIKISLDDINDQLGVPSK